MGLKPEKWLQPTVYNILGYTGIYKQQYDLLKMGGDIALCLFDGILQFPILRQPQKWFLKGIDQHTNWTLATKTWVHNGSPIKPAAKINCSHPTLDSERN